MKNTQYNVGDCVTFYSSVGIQSKTKANMIGDLEFATCSITPKMLTVLDGWYDNQIATITKAGNFIFEDFPYTWPIEVISGLSPNQRKDT